ncbi:hypothetical protein ACOZ38_01110 [Sphaerisporangium viridialbum]
MASPPDELITGADRRAVRQAVEPLPGVSNIVDGACAGTGTC